MPVLSRGFLVAVGVLFGFLGCKDADSDDVGSCQPGTEYCGCLGGTICEGALICQGGFCLDGADTDADTDSMDTGEAGTGETGTMEAGGPEIVDLGTNVNTLTEGESIVFTATVIDPDGPDDLQGGSLKSSDDAITYGAFNDNGNGTFSISLSWAEMHQAEAIAFDGSGLRTFKAVFFDNMGHSASEQTDITLTCEGGCAVDGTCPDTQNDSNHCGACGNICTVFHDDGGCVDGACTPTWSGCYPDDVLIPCTTICENEGSEGCALCGPQSLSVIWFGVPQDCADGVTWDAEVGWCQTQPDASLSSYYRCCCAPQ
jgi:hypothetical protein